MMKTLYQKNEVLFSIIWIVIYVVGTSIADNISTLLGVAKSVTLLFHVILSVALYLWIKQNNLFVKYGLFFTDIPAKKFLYYSPLVLLVSCNLWFGFKMNFSTNESILYVLSMFCVGFLEEVIFRGLLFKAMAQDNIRDAIIISSITFGIGHIINLINGSGVDLVSNICQVIYAIAIGFLFVILFYRGKSLIPCIITHGLFNALSAFGNNPDSYIIEIAVSIILSIIAISYALILLKILPKGKNELKS